MTENAIATVRWGGLNSSASLYGTALTRTPDGDVHLVNDLTPSGTTIQEWYSFTDYQAVRDAPSLPLLRHGKTYRLEPELESTPDESVVFDVRYFDRFDVLIRTDVLYPPLYEFTYLSDAHHYTIRLTNAGCDELRFVCFSLIETTASEVIPDGAR